MGFMHIQNLYQNKDIISLFKECYALEKIHGTSASITYKQKEITLFPGGESIVNFEKLIDKQLLIDKLSTYGNEVVIYGELYGGKQQGMSVTYGAQLKFIVFKASIDGIWINVPEEEKLAKDVGLEYVSYEKIPATIEEINKQRDLDSVQAQRNGMGTGHKREGIVLRPIIELQYPDGSCVISKHKADEFRETKTPRLLSEKPKVLSQSDDVANEWVTEMRLIHVLDKIPGHNITMMKQIISAMIEDILREGNKEIVDTKEAKGAIAKKTADMYKNWLKSNL